MVGEIVVWIDEETYRKAKELAKAWGCKTIEEAIIKAVFDFTKELERDGKIKVCP